MAVNECHTSTGGRPSLEYFTFMFNPSGNMVLTHSHDSRISFPMVCSAVIPYDGRAMSECFSAALCKVTGVGYELIFLYSDMNQLVENYIPPPHIALFEAKEAIPALRSEYKWTPLEELWKSGSDKFSSDSNHWAFVLSMARMYHLALPSDEKPWEKPGWYAKFSNAARSALLELGIQVHEAFEQVRIRSEGAILRTKTSRGCVWLKASTPREGEIVRIVSGFAAELVRQPLFVSENTDSLGHWYITENYGETLDERMTVKDVQKLLGLLGKMHRDSMAHLSALEDVGVPRMDADKVFKQIQPMLEDEQVQEMLGDTVVDYVCLQKFLGCIYESEYSPIALMHGDLDDLNIIRNEAESYVIIDWTTATIDVPYADIFGMKFTMMEWEQIEDERLWNKYMAEYYYPVWQDLGSVEQIEEMSRLVGLKTGLQRLSSIYERANDIALESVFSDAHVDYLRQVLRSINTRINEGKWDVDK